MATVQTNLDHSAQKHYPFFFLYELLPLLLLALRFVDFDQSQTEGKH